MVLDDPYRDRRQTEAKHFILRRYLQEVAFRVLVGPKGWKALTFVDGFSGPWKSVLPDLSDTSFMIAIKILEDAQDKIAEIKGTRPEIRCFFSEADATAFRELDKAVEIHNRPERRFYVRTYKGEFESAVPTINNFIGDSFGLIFIDPTGLHGFSYDATASLFVPRSREVLVNFMYDHFNRFVQHPNEKVRDTIVPLIGGPDWQSRIDTSLSRTEGITKLFRETLKAVGRFDYVISSRIDKTESNRPHFFLAYGTKSSAGLERIREVESKALRRHSSIRAETRREKNSPGQSGLFADESLPNTGTYESVVARDKALLPDAIVDLLQKNSGQLAFDDLWPPILEAYHVRWTDVRDGCVELERRRTIEVLWSDPSSKRRKPKGSDVIRVSTQND